MGIRELLNSSSYKNKIVITQSESEVKIIIKIK